MKKKIRLLLATTCFIANLSQAQTLDESLIKAFENSYSIKVQRQNLEIANAEVIKSYGNWLPSVSTSANLTKSKSISDFGEAGTAGLERHSKGATLNISQNILNGGGSLASLKKTKAQVEEAKTKLDSAEITLLSQVIEVYSKLYLTNETINLYKEEVERLEEHLRAVNIKSDLGESTITAVAQTEAELAKARSDLTNAKGQFSVLKAQYFNLVGEHLAGINKPVTKLQYLPTNIEEALQIAQQHSPDIKKGYTQLDQAKAEVQSAYANILPKLTFDFSSGKTHKPATSSYPKRSYSTSAGLNLRVPIFQRGQEYATLHQQKLARSASRAQLNLINNAVQSEVISSWEDFHTKQHAITAYQAAVNAASTYYKGIELAFKHGLSNNLDYITAQQKLLEAKLSLINAETGLIQSQYKVLSTIGKLKLTHLGLSAINKVDIPY